MLSQLIILLFSLISVKHFHEIYLCDRHFFDNLWPAAFYGTKPISPHFCTVLSNRTVCLMSKGSVNTVETRMMCGIVKVTFTFALFSGVHVTSGIQTHKLAVDAVVELPQWPEVTLRIAGLVRGMRKS